MKLSLTARPQSACRRRRSEVDRLDLSHHSLPHELNRLDFAGCPPTTGVMAGVA